MYAGNMYGTPRAEVERAERNLVLEIEVEGARQVRKALPEATQVFIAPPSTMRCGGGSRGAPPTPPTRSSAGSRARATSLRRARSSST